MAQLDEDLAYFRRTEPLPRELMWEIDRTRAAPFSPAAHTDFPPYSTVTAHRSRPTAVGVNLIGGWDGWAAVGVKSCVVPLCYGRAGVHMRNRLPIFASTRLSKDDSEGEFGFGEVDEVIP